MKMFRKLLCAVLVVAMLAATTMIAFAESRTVYLVGDGYKTDWVYNWDTKASQVTSIKSSNKSVALPYVLEGNNYSYKYLDKSQEDRTDHSIDIGVKLLKTGSAKVSFKVNGKKTEVSYKVKAYTNPVKTFKITPYSSSNLKSKFAKKATVDAKLTKSTNAGKFVVEAATGWRITEARWHSNSEDYGYRYYAWGEGAKKVSLNIPAMKKGNSYYCSVEMTNKANGGTITLYYNMNNY